MTSALIEALVKSRAFSEDTIITANYNTVDLFGRIFKRRAEFKINKIEGHTFELSSLHDNRIIKSDGSEIFAIDGMDLDRYADIYNLHPDGSSKKIGKKRGRKPKALMQ